MNFKISDYEAEPRKREPLWPQCHCFDESCAKKKLAELHARKTKETDDAVAAFIRSRRVALATTADEMVKALFIAGDASGFCRKARRYLAALTLLSLAAKLNDSDDPSTVDLESRSQLDARTFVARNNLEDIFALAEDLMEGSAEGFRKRATKE